VESDEVRLFMDAPVGLRRTTIVVVWVVVLGALTSIASAAPIKLDNDVGVGWSDECTLGGTRPPTGPLCLEPVLIFGAPRFVPDARNVGDLLKIGVNFLDVSFTIPQGNPPFLTNALFLNVGDSALNEVLLPGGAALRLSHAFPEPTDGFVPAIDIVLRLSDFAGFNLLPPGDLVFTVSFNPTMGFDDRSPDRPNRAVFVTLSGPGTVVPEPATLVLLLSGLTSIGLNAGWRRVSRMRASRPIG
jgi:hypothetical protein